MFLKKYISFILLALLLLTKVMIAQEKKCSLVTASPFLNQKLPGETPVPFTAMSMTRNCMGHGSPVFTPDGNEAFWCILHSDKLSTYHARRVDGKWTRPTPLQIMDKKEIWNPFITYDGQKLFIITTPVYGTDSPFRKEIYYFKRSEDGFDFSNPVQVKIEEDLTGIHGIGWNFSITNEGTVYYSVFNKDSSAIYRAEFRDDAFKDAVKLGPEVNKGTGASGPAIAPNGDYLIFSANRSMGAGLSDLYICYRDQDGKWTEAINIQSINSKWDDGFQRLSACEKYLFQVRGGRFYWTDARFIKNLKPDELK